MARGNFRPRGATFWTHVEKTDTCWNWTGRVDRYGYGKASWGADKKLSAHRVVLFLTTGEWPAAGMTVDHLCRNRRCVNPDHLELVTNAENVRRGLLGALRTHCKRGHELTTESLVPWAPPGAKWCVICVRAWHRAHPPKVKAA